MRMRMIALAGALVLVAAAATAGTATVDGVTIKTIHDAYLSLNTTDATPDVINITTNAITETTATLITGDDLTINGDADADSTPCLVTYAGPGGGEAMIQAAVTSGESVTINDLTAIPAYAGASTSIAATAFYVTDDGSPTTDCLVNFNNVTVDASTEAAVPADINADLPTTATQWNTGSLMYASGFRVEATTNPTVNMNVNFNNCVAAHGVSSGFYFQNSAGCTVTATNCTTTRNGGRGFATYALAGVVTLNDCTATYSYDHNLRVYGGGGVVNVNGGSYSDSTGGAAYGIRGEGGVAMIHVVGATIDGNTNRGIGIYSDSVGIDLKDCVITNNGWNGLELNEADLSTVTIDHCLMADNGLFNFRCAVTSSAVLTIPVTNCTFHNPTTDATYNPNGANVGTSWSGFQNCTLDFSNCVFSGGDAVLWIAGGTNNTYNFTNCAFVKSGPYAMTHDPLVFSTGGTGTTETETALVGADPMYVGIATGPVTADSFDIQNTVYATTGPSGNPLTGWGDYIGGLTVVKDWSLF